MGNKPSATQRELEKAKTFKHAKDLLRFVRTKLYDNGWHLREIFRHIDTNNDGTISFDELVEVLGRYGISKHEHKELLEELYKILDKDGDGKIQYNEFLRTLQNQDYSVGGSKTRPSDLLPELTNEELLLRIRNFTEQRNMSISDVFKRLDANNDGSVSKAELKAGLQAIGFSVHPAVVDRLFVLFDTNKDGKINYSEMATVIGGLQFTPQPKVEGDSAPQSPTSAERVKEVEDRMEKALAEERKMIKALKTGKPISKSDSKQQLPQQQKQGSGGVPSAAAAHRRGGKAVMEFAEDTDPVVVMRKLREHIFDNCTSLHACFKELDRNNDGYLSPDELKLGLANYGFVVSDALNKKLFDIFDKDGTGAVSYYEVVRTIQGQDFSTAKFKHSDSRLIATKEWRHCMQSLPDTLTTEEALLRLRNYFIYENLESLKSAFRKVDQNNSGTISPDEFHETLVQVGFKVSRDMSCRLFIAFDSSNDGRIHYYEFIRMLKSGEWLSRDPLSSRSLLDK